MIITPKIATALMFLVVLLVGCASNPAVKIDQVPMYGGVDRSAIPELAEGDQKFIDEVMSEYGDKRSSSEAFVDQGFRFYQGNNMSNAMKRFNQAWLLDDTNPEVYHGFGAVLLNQNSDCAAMDMMKRALGLKWQDRWYNRPGFLADLGYVTALCAAYEVDVPESEKFSFYVQAEQWLLAAEKQMPSVYLYQKWWQSLYHRRDYAAAWDKIAVLRKKGGEPKADVLSLLLKQMPKTE